ncbi:hypothetical protein [Castellaniella sp.]|uniref:hypothetical protein n=1 Tax=Castellaniella sp. TaxID=1955812 RepID=UPI0025C434BF|nr:hypothetical protein [Castellaniella sp.]
MLESVRKVWKFYGYFGFCGAIGILAGTLFFMLPIGFVLEIVLDKGEALHNQYLLWWCVASGGAIVGRYLPVPKELEG